MSLIRKGNILIPYDEIHFRHKWLVLSRTSGEFQFYLTDRNGFHHPGELEKYNTKTWNNYIIIYTDIFREINEGYHERKS